MTTTLAASRAKLLSWLTDSAPSEFQLLSNHGAVTLDSATLRTRIAAAAQQLRAAGVSIGDRVVFRGEQGAGAFISFWAAITVGAVWVPVDPSWPTYLLQRALTRVAPRLALVEADEESVLTPLLPVLMLAETATAEGGLEIAELDDSAPAACLFTSGSTGDPKAVVLSRAALYDSAHRLIPAFDWRAGERLLNLPDPQTMSGLRNALIAAPLAGMQLYCSPQSGRANVFSLVEEITAARPGRIVAAPLLLRHLNLLGDRVDNTVWASVRAIYCTGTDLNRNEVQALYRRAGVPVINYYGLTETVGLCLSQRLADWAPEDATLGYPVGCEVRLVDEHGVTVRDGMAGDLQVLLRHPMSAYFGDPEATAERFDGAWLRTGDIAQRDASGRIVLVGRRSTFLKTATTEKVQPQQIEVVLEQHPAVAEAAVCGQFEPATGADRICALLVAAEGGDVPDQVLAQFVAAHLGSGRVPVRYRWVDSIPRNALGKILRTQLGAYFDV